MSANSCADSCANSWEPYSSAPIGSLAECFYFGPNQGKLFGWLHHPRTTPKTDTGLIVCQPFGYEAICSHRGGRGLAEAAAALGIPALRFDYLGSGDSAELDPEANQIDIWSQDILTAIEELQKRTGVTRICLVGFRMGALLGALAAIRSDAVQALVMVAPVISGRRYLRELRITRLASLLSTGEQATSTAGDEVKDARPRPLEVSGYSLSAATLAALAQIDLANVALPKSCDTLLFDGTSPPAARGWADQLSAAGYAVQYMALPGVSEMMITPPQFLVSSPQMFTETSEWLARHLEKAGSTSRGALSGSNSFPTQAPRTLALAGASASPNAALLERPVFFGTEPPLFGIVTEPSQGEIRRRAVILLNAGADHHVGPSRIYVSIARRWARQGYFVLRMDLAGIGDSGTRTESPDDEVFPPAALDDIRAAMELLKNRYGIRDITLAGLCSGAYHALRAVVAGLPAGRILMVNPLNFFWKQGMNLDDLQVAEVILNPVRYRERVMSGAAWKRLLSGQVNIWRIVEIYVQRALLPVRAMYRDLARRLHIRLSYDLGRELEEVVERGVHVVFVFAHGEPGVELLKIEAGSVVKRMGAKCRVRIIERADHAFSHSGPRAALEDTLSEELFSRSDFGAAQHG
jgi:alpha-beta hydrolase superfamily lysophospholipase